MEINLERVDRRIIFLNDESYRWIVVKRFRQSHPVEDLKQNLLPALLAHPSYRDDYASPKGETEAPIHGRYRLDAISSDVFDEVTPSRAASVLNVWLEQLWPLDRNAVDDDLDEVFALLRQSPLVLQLRTLGEEAEHEWGWVVGRNGFHEFVVIEPDGGVVVLVAGDD